MMFSSDSDYDVMCKLCGLIFHGGDHHDCPAQGPEALACYRACATMNPDDPIGGLDKLLRDAAWVARAAFASADDGSDLEKYSKDVMIKAEMGYLEIKSNKRAE